MENNQTEWSLARLDQRGKELTLAINGNYLSGERKLQVQHEISLIALELWCRHRDEEIEFVENPERVVK